MQQQAALQAKQQAVVRRKTEEAEAARRRLKVRSLWLMLYNVIGQTVITINTQVTAWQASIG